ncbi:MAG: hypothetical protein HKN94_10710 [Acidimicrobiales bacterium]|nr:hypothetical protein [Acidimicrobiales bacterium]
MNSIAPFTPRACRSTRRFARDEDMRALVHELPAGLRDLRLATLTESMRNGVPINPWALTVLLAAHADRVDDPMVWMVDDVETLLWHAITDFVTERGLRPPEDCGSALHACLAAAVREELLEPGSDCTRHLFVAVNRLITH